MVALIGEASPRVEDRKFLTGAGKYLDDLKFSDVCHAVFIRSPHAHARILSLSAAIAKEMPGVLEIICLLYTSPSPRDRQKSRMPSSA